TRGDGYVVLSWNAPKSNGGTKVTAYNIYRDGSKIATVDASSLTYRDENMDMQTEHTYYVTALNAVGESNKSQERSVSWSTPSSPQNVKAKSTSDGALLTWDTPSDDGGSAVKKYEIYLKENGEWKKVGEATSNEYKLKLNPTLTGGTAKVKIVPVNGVGPGEEAILEVNVPMNMMLWGAIIAVIIILIVAIVVVVKRKK
ncbi:MAG: fibronectin type III domain-containing protein, partial [Thermoplasmata archaeon]|nr:fibronectin type III domain-containing protein [Thermoplasmata archaeon]